MFFAALYIFLIIQRVLELLWARRNERIVKAKGAVEFDRNGYKNIVFLHVLFFISLLFEKILFHRHPSAAFLDPETGSWESWEASMLRDEVAQMFGFPFAHDMGIDRISWISNLVTNWMGDHGFLRNLNVKLTLPNVYGDATWCYGMVNRSHQDRGRNLAELDLWCENQRGEQTAYGNATVELPTKSMGASQDGLS